MKICKPLAAVVCCMAMLFALTACGGTSQQSSSSSSVTKVSSDPFYVLIVGNDTRQGTADIADPTYSNGEGHADTMMVARVDPTNYKVTFVSIPRDTVIELNGTKTNITDTYANGGMANAVAAAEMVTGEKMKYYFNCTFVQFVQFVDGINSIKASVPVAITLDEIVSGGEVSLSAGVQDLNGGEALALARMRSQYSDDNEACRQIQDRQLVQDFIQKALDNPKEAVAYATTLFANTETNMSFDEMTQYVTMFLDNSSKVTFYSGTGPYEVVEPDDYYFNWSVKYDAETWKNVMSAVDAGNDPQSVVALPIVEHK